MEFLGCHLEIVDVEPSFEEPTTGEFYWMAPYAQQAAETKKTYRKQVLAGTVLRAVGRVLPDFIVGIQQGAMIAALCSNPLLLEMAARQRVATDAELVQLRAGWPGVQGILAIQPFVTVAHSTMERLLEAIPEVTGGRRILTCNYHGPHHYGEEVLREPSFSPRKSDFDSGFRWSAMALSPRRASPRPTVAERRLRGLREEGPAHEVPDLHPPTSPHLCGES